MFKKSGPRLFQLELADIADQLAKSTNHDTRHIRHLLLAPSPESADRQVIDWLEDIILASGDHAAGLASARRLLKDFILSQQIND